MHTCWEVEGVVARGWVNFWLGGNASLTIRHLLFIRIAVAIECDCPSVRL